MYDVGFGDAFLLLLPTPEGRKKVLVDCGSIKKDVKPLGDIVEAIIEAVRDEDGTPRIDVVIASHRHKDHVAGFAHPGWAEVDVREVWMPWTENPKDPKARRIRDAQSKLAVRLHAALELRLQASPGSAEVGGLLELAANALSNEQAMHTLHAGFRRTYRPERRYLPASAEERTLHSDALPGVVVHVLGPSHDEEVIRDMNPPAGESYLRLLDSCGPDGETPAPFGPEWELDSAAFADLGCPHWNLTAKEKKDLRALAQDMDLAVAVALDSAINGTSLMLMFQLGQTHLLFPGDAQWGTWRMVLDDPEWRALLGKTVFYKIGHHGSHNATPKEFVEQVLGTDFWGMASVKPVKQWKGVPKKQLLEALRKRSSKVVRSDEAATQLAKGFTRGDNYVEAEIPIDW
jgi:beta-lactamase superfamily II metal-dependent hydrolase